MLNEEKNTRRRGEGLKIDMEVVGSFDNLREWLSRIGKDRMVVDVMEGLGQMGVDSLADNTPVDTGETASSWGYDLKVRRDTSELSWYNTAHPHVSGNMARMIYTGYGNRTGGYIPPRDYITPAMTPLYEDAVYKIVEAIMSG